jgi:hypothetical protein
MAEYSKIPDWYAYLAHNFSLLSLSLKRQDWASTAYVQVQMHPFDLLFYDKAAGKYTVDKYLDDLHVRYGGIDAALVWPHYPNIGADNRNQFDLFRALPGGIKGITRFTQELSSAGVKVLWPYIEWDTATRREEGWQPLGQDNTAGDAKTMVGLLKQTVSQVLVPISAAPPPFDQAIHLLACISAGRRGNKRRLHTLRAGDLLEHQRRCRYS